MKIIKKLPSNVGKSKSLSFSLPLNGKAVFNSIYDSKEQIKYNLINYLLTNRKERVFNSNFGANLRSLLFEGIEFEKLDFLQDKIQDNIKEYFPQVEILKLKFEPSFEYNELNFLFKYKIKGYDIEDEIEINIQ